MPEIVRDRDVVTFVKGIAYTVAVHPSLITSGWPGGLGLSWDDSPLDEFRVTTSDGERGAGFALWGSNEDSDVLTGMTENQPLYGFIVVCSGSWIMSTRTYETHTLASGRTVPITYAEGDKLLWSLTGRLTTEDEWTVAADPRAPNENYVAFVVQAPSTLNDNYLTVQTIL